MTDRLLPGFSDRSHRGGARSLASAGGRRAARDRRRRGHPRPGRAHRRRGAARPDADLGDRHRRCPARRRTRGRAGQGRSGPGRRPPARRTAHDGRVFVIGDLAGTRRRRRPAAAGRTRRHPAGPVRRRTSSRRELAGEPRAGPVPVPRQGQDGHDRAHRRGRRAAARHPVPRLPRVDRLAGAAPAVAGRLPQPRVGAGQLGVELPHLRPRGPGADRPARGRGDRQLQGPRAPIVGGPPGRRPTARTATPTPPDGRVGASSQPR